VYHPLKVFTQAETFSLTCLVGNYWLFSNDKLPMKGFILILLLGLLSCGKETGKSSLSTQNVSPIYSSSELKIKVYYEAEAEPYTDQLTSVNKSLWDIFEVNLNTLFTGRPTSIQVPKTLDQMVKLKTYDKATWSVEDVLQMAKDYPVSEQKGVTQFQIFFVKGNASDNPSIIGFHISNTQIMVIFKDVVKSTAIGNAEIVPKYVEQATLVHEMGHALGLVNNGLPMQSPHNDSKHHAHCSNENCVMYYANEGSASLMKYIQKILLENRLVMFDQHCVNDAVNFKK
jgi:predicted Zn-dependent protease